MTMHHPDWTEYDSFFGHRQVSIERITSFKALSTTGTDTMLKTTLFTPFLCLLLSATQLLAGSGNLISLKLPEPVIASAVTKCLPIPIDTSSDSIGGSLFIKTIDNLRLESGAVSAHIVLIGNGIRIKTSIAGHEIQLNLGNVQLDFNTTAHVRYEPKKQTLLITPTITDIGRTQQQKSQELATLLTGLLNNRVFPIKIEQLQPTITDLGNRQLAFNVIIQEIHIRKNALLLYLIPDIKTSGSTLSFKKDVS